MTQRCSLLHHQWITQNDVYHKFNDVTKYCLFTRDWNKVILKGTATLMINIFYQKELHIPWILIQVSSKSVEKWGSYGHLKNSIWPTLSRHFEYLISFQNFSYCLVLSYQYYHNICVQQICSSIHKENVLVKMIASNSLVCLLFWLCIFN